MVAVGMKGTVKFILIRKKHKEACIKVYTKAVDIVSAFSRYRIMYEIRG